MGTATKPREPRTSSNGTIPWLESGDHLTRAEFERRYDAMPDLKKAELIDGVVYVASPVRHRQHGRPHNIMGGWLLHYEASTPGVEAGSGSSLRLDDENEPQPDGLLIIQPEWGGQAEIDDEGYIVGGPELVGEVSASTASLDLNQKLGVYRRFRVQEYVVWRVLDNEVDWFIRKRGQFQRRMPGRDGILKSLVFPGLWLDPEAMVRCDVRNVLKVLAQGLNSSEHAAFVERLKAKRS